MTFVAVHLVLNQSLMIIRFYGSLLASCFAMTPNHPPASLIVVHELRRFSLVVHELSVLMALIR